MAIGAQTPLDGAITEDLKQLHRFLLRILER
jgi:hypothetical protein